MKPSPKLIETFGVSRCRRRFDVVGPIARDIRDPRAARLGLHTASGACSDILTLKALCRFRKMGLCLPAHDPVADFSPLERAASVLGSVSTQDGTGLVRGARPGAGRCIRPAESFDRAQNRPRPSLGQADTGHSCLSERQAKSTLCRLAGRTCGAGSCPCQSRCPVCGDTDFLITPSAPGEAPLGLERTGPATYNIRSGLTPLGCPSRHHSGRLSARRACRSACSRLPAPDRMRPCCGRATAVEDRLRAARHRGAAAKAMISLHIGHAVAVADF